MWYEILPFGGILFAMIVLPNYAHLACNKLFNNGHSVARNLPKNHWDFIGYTRDDRLTGSYYKAQGLETLPEEK